jgi:hypothetical protein
MSLKIAGIICPRKFVPAVNRHQSVNVLVEAGDKRDFCPRCLVARRLRRLTELSQSLPLGCSVKNTKRKCRQSKDGGFGLRTSTINRAPR